MKSNAIISKRELESITTAHCAVPHDFLGMHKCRGGIVARAYLPNAKTCSVVDLRDSSSVRMRCLDKSGFFEIFIPRARKIYPHKFKVGQYDGKVRFEDDAYAFQPTLGKQDIYLFGLGDERKIYNKLGSQIREIDGVKGVSFAVWAPTARRVSVVGDFNNWDGRYNQLRSLGTSGLWEIFVPNAKVGDKYKYEILGGQNPTPFLKSDPYAVRFEPPPNNSSIVWDLSGYEWGDSQWLEKRANTDWSSAAISGRLRRIPLL